MMKLRYWLATLALTQVATTSTVLAAGFQVSPRVGNTTLRLDADATTRNTVIEKDAFLVGVTLGYVTPIGLMFEGGYGSQNNSDWFDDQDKYRLSEYTLAAGWQFATPHGFRITPKVGRTRWDLYSDDAPLTYAQVDTNTRRGYDNFWELTLQKTITDSIALGVTFKDNPYDFGNVKSIAFTASFGL